MTRLAIVAPKSYQREVIEALHASKLAHIEEYTADEEETALRIGDPLPDGSTTSQTLVTVRSIVHTLGVEDDQPDRQLTTEEIRSRLENELPRIREEVNRVDDRRAELRSDLEDKQDRASQLAPLADLPLSLDDYRGYESLTVFVGRGPEHVSNALATGIDRYECFSAGQTHAVFVANEQAEKAQEILTREGFQHLEVPEGDGSVTGELTDLDRDINQLETSLEDIEAALSKLAEEHKDLLLCAEEDLSISVEKAEAPLDFASTERTFVVDTWVPTSDLDDLKTTVSEAARGRVHFETMDEGQMDAHGREEKPPTRYDHPTGVSPFSFLMDTFSTPKYDEIDPTIILTLVFPLFFGFMIGDLGYGVLMMALGFYLWKSVGPKSEAAHSIGFALLVSGAWATLFGAIVFHDAFGIPYVVHGDEGGLAWFTYHGHAGLLGPLPVETKALTDPILLKLGDAGVKSMLALSVLAAFVHLFLGFVFAFVNHLGHDAKHAFAQIGWIVTLTGLFLLTLLNGPANGVSAYLAQTFGLGTAEWTSHGVEAIHFSGFATMLPWYSLAPGVVILVLTEGFMGVMETFSLLSNVISYTRLAGVAVAKGAMALAFNGIFLEDMVLHGESAAVLVVGFVLFVLAQLLVFVLGMISSSIQGIRLNYVEFFLKFFEGGGESFSPFGRERRFTVSSEPEV